MSNGASNNNNKSEVQQSAQEVNPQQVKQNLKSGESGSPENLSKKEKTEFIEEDLRTDK